MTALARRYNAPLLVMLLAAVAVWSLWTRHPTRTDSCAEPQLLTVSSLIPGTKWAGKHPKAKSADIIHWSMGDVTADGGDPSGETLQYQIVRFYGSPRKLLRPYTLIEGMTFEADRSLDRRLDTAAGPVDVQILFQDTSGPTGLVAYFYAQDGRSFTNAFARLLVTAPGQFLHGGRPVTLFVVSGPTRRIEPAVERAVKWLGDAWLHYRNACVEGG
jgi:hypothetical protein